jgi:membrane protein
LNPIRLARDALARRLPPRSSKGGLIVRGNAILGLIRQTLEKWYADNPFQMGAALAYYALFSLAPLVLIAIAVAGAIFGESAARAELALKLEDAVGPNVASAIQESIRHTANSKADGLAAAFGVVMLMVSAAGTFGQLQSGLNVIWGVQARPDRGWLETIKDRIWPFTVVLCFGALLLLSLILSTTISALSMSFHTLALPSGLFVWRAIDWTITFGLITIFFAIIYRLLPDVEIAWRDVWVGAVATAILFGVGKYLIGLYIAKSSWISAYGAAGSLVVVLLWVFYSSQIFLIGAEFTYIWARRNGKSLIALGRAIPKSKESAYAHNDTTVMPR